MLLSKKIKFNEKLRCLLRKKFTGAYHYLVKEVEQN